MATWSDLVDYMQSRYEMYIDSNDALKLTFSTGGGRHQVVLLSKQVLGKHNEEWVIMEAPFARLGDVRIKDVLEEIGTTVCGGAALVQDTLTLRHAVPLQNLDIRNFEAPLILVVVTADRLEAKYAGVDVY